MERIISILGLLMLIFGLEKPSLDIPNTNESFQDMHLGLFTHYMHPAKAYQWGATLWADGTKVKSLDELADHFDAEDFARTAASMHAQYVIFTTWHANMNVLFPSEVMKEMLPGHCSKRDLIRDLINVLRPKGIRLILYIHPSDGHDFSLEDQNLVGWNEKPPYERWNDFVNQVIAEVIDRYGDDLYGFYIDGGLPRQINAPRLRKTIKDKMPEAWLIQNSGLNSDCADFGAHERMSPPYPATAWLRCQTITEEWWAMSAPVTFNPDLAYQFTVLQASVHRREGGGVAWSFGPHPGGRWELGVRSFCTRLGELVENAGNSLFNTRPSKSYLSKDQTPLLGLKYVATESTDGVKTFLHIFKPPKTNTLKLPPPADQRNFSSAKFLHGGKIDLSQDNTGVLLTVNSTNDWDDIDSIIELK